MSKRLLKSGKERMAPYTVGTQTKIVGLYVSIVLSTAAAWRDGPA